MGTLYETLQWMTRDLRVSMDDFGFTVYGEEKENDNMDKPVKMIMCDGTVYTIGVKKFVPEVNVTDISVYNEKVVELTFVTGEVYKAVCDDTDKFDINKGIEVCILKYLLNGSNDYNNLVKKIRKQYDQKCEAEKKDAERHEQMKRKRAKRQAAKKRRAERKREEQIEMQKEAYVRAMKEMKNETCQCGKDTAK